MTLTYDVSLSHSLDRYRLCCIGYCRVDMCYQMEDQKETMTHYWYNGVYDYNWDLNIDTPGAEVIVLTSAHCLSWCHMRMDHTSLHIPLYLITGSYAVEDWANPTSTFSVCKPEKGCGWWHAADNKDNPHFGPILCQSLWLTRPYIIHTGSTESIQPMSLEWQLVWVTRLLWSESLVSTCM